MRPFQSRLKNRGAVVSASRHAAHDASVAARDAARQAEAARAAELARVAAAEAAAAKKAKEAERHLAKAANLARHELNKKLRSRVRAVMPLIKQLVARGMNRTEAIKAALAQTPASASGMSGCEWGNCTCC